MKSLNLYGVDRPQNENPDRSRFRLLDLSTTAFAVNVSRCIEACEHLHKCPECIKGRDGRAGQKPKPRD
jgi:hypothetical protein